MNWAATQIYLGSAYQDRIRGERAENIDRAIRHLEQALEVFTRDNYPEQWTKVQEGLAIVYRERNRDEYTATVSPMDSSPSLTYRQFYNEESQLRPGKKRNVKLIDSIVPDSPYLTTLILLYQREENLPHDEARNLALRAVAYISCAIYDVTINAGLLCQPSPIPNGRRPAWILEGERVPVSLTLSDIDESDRTCRMTIGTMSIAVGEPPSDRTRWERLHESFKGKFSVITV